MKIEMKNFIAEGLNNYKRASHVMMEFFRNTQNELQEILKKRKDWGNSFKPQEANKVKSTKFWDEYPLINAQIYGSFGGEPAIVKIAINWFQAESDYPFYAVWVYDGPAVLYEKIAAYKKTGRIELLGDEKGLKFAPNPNKFNMESDFNLLIDEFVKTISK